MIIVASHGWNALWLAFFLCDYSPVLMRLFVFVYATIRNGYFDYSHEPTRLLAFFYVINQKKHALLATNLR